MNDVEQVQKNMEIQPLVATTETVTETRDNNRQRRLPRHLRVGNQRRRENQPSNLAPSIPLVAAVASPELASGKVWIQFATP